MKQYDDLMGRTFSTPDRVSFTIVEVEPYPADRVSTRYREILSIEKGWLVAVDYRGTLIPNITVKGGVARLTKVRVGDKLLDRPGAVSKALGITLPMHAYRLTTHA